MIKCVKVEDTGLVEAYCKKCGIEYESNIYAYNLEENEVKAGVLLFYADIPSQTGKIFYVNCKNETDPLFIEMLIKSALNSLDWMGIETVTSSAEKYSEIFKKIGFSNTPPTLELNGYFTPCEQ